MKIEINCPQCETFAKKAVFNIENLERDRDFNCNHCNLSFSVGIEDFGRSGTKVHEGPMFRLIIKFDNHFQNFNDNLLPVLSCILCKHHLNFEVEDAKKKCGSCGVEYVLEIELLGEVLTQNRNLK